MNQSLVGENENEICKLIQKDDVENFIIYMNKNSISFDASIKQSIYETNPFLFDFDDDISWKRLTLIIYAAFYASIQIFQYLISNGAELGRKICNSAIHGKNAEIFHILEEKNALSDEFITEDCLTEAIKCHHNEFAKYIINNYISKDNDYTEKGLKFYNFEFVNAIDKSLLFILSEYDYFILFDMLLNDKSIDLSENKYCLLNKSLYFASKNNNIEIVKLLLASPNINVNFKKISIIKYFFNNIIKNIFNAILNKKNY